MKIKKNPMDVGVAVIPCPTLASVLNGMACRPLGNPKSFYTQPVHLSRICLQVTLRAWPH